MNDLLVLDYLYYTTLNHVTDPFIIDGFCVFLPLDGRCNNNGRRRETFF